MPYSLALLILAFLSTPCPAEEAGGVLAEGTPFETPWVQIDGKAPGPTVFIVGGVHGDESAGFVAAEAVSHWSVGRGRLVVVPRANPPAIAAGTRRIPGFSEEDSNLNRHFPSEGSPHDGIAAELWSLVEAQHPDWLLDLHEGFDIKRVNDKSVGRSIIPCDDPRTRELAEALVALADSTIEDPERAFTLLKSPIVGSLARAAWDRLGVRSIIVETTKGGGSVPSRARRHRLLVHAVLTSLEMEPCDPHTLVDPVRADDRPCIALFDDSGASASGVRTMRAALTAGDEFVVRHLDAEDIRAGRLAPFDLVVHPGGSGSEQGRALGTKGRRIEREFVRDGGAFLGVCAGAYLAAANYDWSLGVIDANVIDREHWRRGSGDVSIDATPTGRELLGAPTGSFEIRYINGPILEAADRPEIPDYTPLLHFRGEVTENGAPSGVMPGTPAAVAGGFGEGRAMAISPHPERTAGRAGLLRSGISWLVEDEPGQELAERPGPFQATGIRIGEVTSNSAIVWTRLTAEPEREEASWEVPGVEGQVRVSLWRTDDPEVRVETEWTRVDPAEDFTFQFQLDELEPGSRYSLEVLGRAAADGEVTSRTAGGFDTAPAADDPAEVRFTVVTGQGFHRRDDRERGHAIYPAMLALDPDFFVHTGDTVYYDRPDPVARDVAVARAHWHRMYSLPHQREFHAEVASYFIKDDHDTLKDDCWPGQKNGELTFEDGVALFREQVPMAERTYRTVRWGRDLQIWMVEGRDFRSSNKAPDGPEKTILGAEQLEWLERTMRASEATFRVLISATPIVGPDREKKADNHANRAFAHEGRRLRVLLASLGNAVVICGDRHWQYVSEDPETGLVEFSCGPTSDAHAGGFSEAHRSSMHRHLRVAGGFLEGVVGRKGERASLTLRHHQVDGAVCHEEVIDPPE